MRRKAEFECYRLHWRRVGDINSAPVLPSFECLFCHFTVKCSFPPKIRTTIFGVFLVLRSTKALGGIITVIILISTDSILVDDTSLMLMGSTGWHLEVIVIP